MKNPEYEKTETRSKDETGFSEKQLDIDTEIQAGEWQSLELRHLRMLQEVLLQCMVWEPKGELQKNMVPQELWELSLLDKVVDSFRSTA